MRRLTLAAAVLVLLADAGLASAARGPRGDVALQKGARIYSHAREDVTRAHPRCEFRPARSFTHARPSAELLATLGVLRRPATPEDRIARSALWDGDGIYIDWARVAHATGGRSFWIVPSRGGFRPVKTPAGCARLLRRRLRALLAGKPAGVRRSARRFARFDPMVHPWPPHETTYLYDREPDGSVGEGWDFAPTAELREEGLASASGAGFKGPSTVVVVVPDGVASVTATYPRRGIRGARGKVKVYPSRLEVTAPVQENIAWFELARRGWDAHPRHMTWRAADGSIVKVVSSRSGVNIIR